MGGVFRPSQDGESENPGTNEWPGELRRGGPFFCLLFFGPTKKSEPLAGRRVEALHLVSVKNFKATSTAFVRWRGRVHFFCQSTKETEPKKNDSPTKQIRPFIRSGIFRLAIHGSVEKRRPSMGGALRVWKVCRRVIAPTKQGQQQQQMQPQQPQKPQPNPPKQAPPRPLQTPP